MLRFTTHILLWVFLAIAVPLTGLSVGALWFGERWVRERLNEDMAASVLALQSELERHRFLREQAIRALVQSAALEAFLPVLRQSSRGDIHPQLFERGERLGDFVAGFAKAIPEISGVRILDAEGNGLLDINLDVPTTHESFAAKGRWRWREAPVSLNVAEELAATPVNEVRYLELFGARNGERRALLLDAVIVLQLDGERVGYLAAALDRLSLDRMLDFQSLPYGGWWRLLEQPGYAGAVEQARVLYDGNVDVRLSKPVADRLYRPRDGGLSWSEEYLPYPNRLRLWTIQARVPPQAFSSLFRPLMAWVLGSALVLLLATLLFTRFAARRIVRPLSDLKTSLDSLDKGDGANGRQALPVLPSRRGQRPSEVAQLEAAYQALAQRLMRARGERDRAQEALLQQAKLANLGQMAAGLGHELNTPLNNALALLSLMQRQLADDAGCGGDDRDLLQADVLSLREEVLRASAIVAGLLEFAHQIPINKRPLLFADWLDGCLERFQPVLQERDLCLRLQGREQALEEAWQLEADSEALQRMLWNLLNNAAQVSAPGDALSIVLRRQRCRLIVELLDQGPGFDPELLSRLFEPFFTTKAVGEGSGLGLSIALGIVEAHGGHLSLENRAEGGCVARLDLPLVEEGCGVLKLEGED